VSDANPDVPLSELEKALAECAGEPVHTPGAIQPFGVLLCLDAKLERVLQVSANVADILGLSVADCLGARTEAVLGKALLGRLQRGLAQTQALPGALTLTRKLDGESRRLHVAAFRTGHEGAGEGLVLVELEPMETGTRYRWLSRVNEWLGRLVRTTNQVDVMNGLARAVRDITGYDRVLVYRFDPRWNGEVIAEDRNDQLPALLGHHFPASDIPPQVRALYERNPIRVIANAQAASVRLEPPLNPLNGQPLDLTASSLRGASPVHCEYLRNMGVGAACSVAIHSDAGLWGLVACHSKAPATLSPSGRDSALTLVQVAGQRLFLLKAQAESRYREQIHESRVLLAKGVQSRQSPSDLVRDYAPAWLELFDACGLVLVYRKDLIRLGNTPEADWLARLVVWLERTHAEPEPWSTVSLADAGFPLEQERPIPCCGLLAMPLVIDMDTRGWLLFFRPEQAETRAWAGQPQKELNYEQGKARLSPRESFATWHEEVKGRSRAWRSAELRAVRDLGDDLAVIESAHEISRLNESLKLEREALARANGNLRELAHTDTLTGTMNRYRIEHQVQIALANAQRYGQPLSLLLFDIDHFKQVNDTLGHEAGDQVLKGLVHCVETNLREGDQLGRWGGEEFLVLVPNTCSAEAVVLGERLRHEIEITDFDLRQAITVSVGVAEWRPNDSLKSLLERADRAMYKAKKNGRNRVCLAPARAESA